MEFKLVVGDAEEFSIDESEVVGLASTSCMAFVPIGAGDEFVVGTEEGDIYKCSTAFTTEYARTTSYPCVGTTPYIQVSR